MCHTTFTLILYTLCTRSVSLLVVVVLFNTGLSHAQQAQGEPPLVANADATVPAECAELHSSQQIDALQTAARACAKDPLFLAQLGYQLNRAGRFADAADHLERALMLEPNLKDAQFSYAIAMTGLGDLAAAQALLDNLLQDPQLPAPLRERLGEQRNMLTRPQAEAVQGSFLAAKEAWQSRVTLGTRLGYDSNLLGAPNLESLTLTFAGQTLDLPLDASYLARGGAYARVEAQLDVRRFDAMGAQWSALVALRSRNSSASVGADSMQFDFSLERSSAHSMLGNYANVSVSAFQPQSGSRYAATGLGGGWAGTWRAGSGQPCQARAGLEVQDRQYQSLSVLSGRYNGQAAAITCDLPDGAQWALGLRTGRDQALDSARPGGDQAQSSLRLSTFTPLAAPLLRLAATNPLPPAATVLSYDYALQQDTNGYSAYIDSGRTRVVRRQSVRLELQQPISHTARWVLGLDWASQSSTLALFQQQSWGASVGYQQAW